MVIWAMIIIFFIHASINHTKDWYGYFGFAIVYKPDKQPTDQTPHK